MSSPGIGNGVQRLSISTEDELTSPAPNSGSTGQHQRYNPTFTGLPAELKRLIVHNSDDDSLPNLRLTCKELNEIASKPFGERCLAERCFMMSDYSLQGLVDLTAHPVFGPCVRRVLINTYSFTVGIEDWLKTTGKNLPKAEREAKWKHLDAADSQISDLIGTQIIIRYLAVALLNLKEHGQRVTFGLRDDVIHRGTDHEILRKAYGFEQFWGIVSPLNDLDIKQWGPARSFLWAMLGFAITSIDAHNEVSVALELDLAVAIDRSNDALDGGILAALMMSEDKVQREVDICLKIGLDWTIRFFRPDPKQDYLVLNYHGTTVQTCKEEDIDPGFLPHIIGPQGHELRYGYGSGNTSYYSPCMLGKLYEAITMEKLSEICMESCASEASFTILEICKMGSQKLQKLALIDTHLFESTIGRFGFLDQKKSAWPFLYVVRSLLRDNCPNLQSFVLDRVFFYAEDDTAGRAVITGKRREWKGKDGVLSGLACLIAEMTTLDEEQQERWFKHEIDADGNDLVATVEDE
ncbi:hypothetical protein D6C79_07259 [Aureobasidium pullulans]|nr:hypothetical protein D6C79_07259 [Aureobasidium pullulans]